MGWESGGKTWLKDKTFSLLFFFASAHLKAIVCIFLVLVNPKDNYVVFSDKIALTWRLETTELNTI